ncbi:MULTISPECIES: response regulator [unclassified Devosia]|uniref:response regulator n=1 Tax=unclassified Devosia TaxID=196773 RepID=UPI000FDB3B18|nr:MULTISPECIES: response regulator [unclassified Devosia]
MSDDYTPFALVSDDNVLIRMDAARILEDAGFRVYEAGEVGEALAILEESHASIQLLFTDVEMPPGELNGFDLARTCAKNWPDIAIVVSSGHLKPQPGDMPDGAVFIGKPFSADVVYDHLQEIMPDDIMPEQLKKAAKRES